LITISVAKDGVTDENIKHHFRHANKRFNKAIDLPNLYNLQYQLGTLQCAPT